VFVFDLLFMLVVLGVMSRTLKVRD